MNKITKAIKTSTLILILLFAFLANAQVGIGTTTPASGALLDLTDASRGLLVPRVTIGNLATAAPVTAPTTGLLVWNLDVATGVGFHYWNSSAWVPIGGVGAANAWNLAGNAITGAEFLGTTSTHDLDIRSDNIDRMRVQSNGQVSVNFGGVAANVGDQFSALGTSAINGYSDGSGTGVYGQNIATGDGVWGVNSGSGNGVWGWGITSAIGVRGESDSGIATLGISNSGVGAQGQSSSSAGVIGFGSTFGTLGDVTGGVGAQGQATSGDGVRGFSTSGDGVYGQSTTGNGMIGFSTDGLGVFALSTNLEASQSISTNNTGAVGVSNSNTETGVAGTSDGSGFYSILTDGSGVAGAGVLVGVYGTANTTSAAGWGGYFENDGIYSYVGGWQQGPWTARKILGNGTVSTIVKGTNGDLLTMSTPETPEILFQDYGIGQLENGTARITIDPNFAKNIRVDADHPLKVFVQLEGDCNGVFVTNKSSNGFDVKELQGGNSNVTFSWSITATRADDEIISSDGRVRISHNGGRFQPAPGPMKKNRKEIINTKNEIKIATESLYPSKKSGNKIQTNAENSDKKTKLIKINSNQE